MYDPTIFDNLKVVAEGAVYDADREGNIKIVGRQDLVDLAVFSRTFSMDFEIPGIETSKCRIELSSALPDFAAELAKMRLAEEVTPGCRLLVSYQFFGIQLENSDLQVVENFLKRRWSEEIVVTHKSSILQVLHEQQYVSHSLYTADIQFQRKIDEDQIQELEEMLQHAVGSFQHLQRLLHK